MSDVGYISIYANAVAIMLSLGVAVLVYRFKMEDPLEKKIFLGLQYITIAIAVFYILCALRDDKVIPCNQAGAIAIETCFEFTINLLAIVWFIYMDYRIFHSRDHLKRRTVMFFLPISVMFLLDIVNIFTGILIRFDEDLTYIEMPLYVLSDLIRTGYFVASIVVLALYKKQNERMKFFKALPFFVPMFLYIVIYYFTPYATVALGLSMGLTLLFVEMVNEQCYQDYETGFYNRLYLAYLKNEIAKGKYDLESAIIFKLSSDTIETPATLIHKQLPRSVDTIRYRKDTILTLARVNDRSSLHMLSEDVTDSLAASDIEVSVRYDLKKKKETCQEFLDRFLEKA